MFDDLNEKIINFDLNKYMGFTKAGIVQQEFDKEFVGIIDEIINYDDTLTNPSEVISTFVEKMIQRRSKNVEAYLENIINSASTINKIAKYYSVSISSDDTEMYILFKDKIIKTYGISKEDYYRELRMEMWVDMGLPIKPEPILFIPPGI